MAKEISRGFAYQPYEPTPENPSEILTGISFDGVNYIDVEDYKKLQEVLKKTYETGREMAGELEKENQQLKSVLNEVREEVYEYKKIMEDGTEKGAYYLYLGSLLNRLDKLEEILNKVGDK